MRKANISFLYKICGCMTLRCFFRYVRMLPETLEHLLKLVAPDITKEVKKMREPISADQRLVVTLRYLATGDSHATIAASYRMSATTVGRIISETCTVLWDRLKEAGFISNPSTATAWKKIANEFESRWNFPNALGAIDGKHVVMYARAKQGSNFFNYKKHIVLCYWAFVMPIINLPLWT